MMRLMRRSEPLTERQRQERGNAKAPGACARTQTGQGRHPRAASDFQKMTPSELQLENKEETARQRGVAQVHQQRADCAINKIAELLLPGPPDFPIWKWQVEVYAL